MDQYTPEEILLGFGIMSDTRVALAVATAICIWDWLATLTMEIEHVWKSSKLWTFLNVTFLVNRYGCIITMCCLLWLMYLPADQVETCNRAFWMQPFLPILIYISASVIVILRVFAIWNRNKVVLAVLWTLLAAQVAIQIWSVHNAQPSLLPAPINGCGWLTDNTLSWLYYASMLVFDTVVLFLMLFRTGKMYRQSGLSALTFVLLRDQVLFFFVTFAAGVANLILFTKPGENRNAALLAPFTLIMVSIASNRILLNMRSVPVSTTDVPSSFLRKAGTTSRSRADQNLPNGPFQGVVSITPMSPIHHPQYPDLSGKASERDSEYELEKMTV